ncbi:phage tail protein [Yinghuangia seranimata]|uniref:phage tail protein n=1 Tax=Yinghuangia seranimata TaxID=408067 RepID=UPI00248B07E9|nr:phage tail protein [Yinghuangia seranimata]MDI2125265.1 phage tail protein [Yinghuangia seranimata]
MNETPWGRRALPGLAVAYPLGGQLPAVYADDDLTQRLTAAFDEVLAPILTTLDNLADYLDPALAPEDFVAMLAAWLGADGPGREPVASAVRLHRSRGTRAGLADAIRVAFGVEAEIEDSGGTAWSARPGAALPGSGVAMVTVRVRAEKGIDEAALRAVVAANVPAGCGYVVEVEGAGAGAG